MSRYRFPQTTDNNQISKQTNNNKLAALALPPPGTSPGKIYPFSGCKRLRWWGFQCERGLWRRRRLDCKKRPKRKLRRSALREETKDQRPPWRLLDASERGRARVVTWPVAVRGSYNTLGFCFFFCCCCGSEMMIDWMRLLRSHHVQTNFSS